MKTMLLKSPPCSRSCANYSASSKPLCSWCPTPLERVRHTLSQLKDPLPVQELRKLCGIRTAAVCSALEQLSALGEISRDSRGYQIIRPFPVSQPIHPQGNGNGKQPPPPASQ